MRKILQSETGSLSSGDRRWFRRGAGKKMNNNNNNNNKKKKKKLKYKSLCLEIQRMWNLKCTITPLIIGATGVVMRSLRKNLEAVPGTHSIDSLQKTAILGISHMMRKVLQCEA